MSVQVRRRPYFDAVTATAGSNRTAWEEALDLWALAMARCLFLDRKDADGGATPQAVGGPL